MMNKRFVLILTCLLFLCASAVFAENNQYSISDSVKYEKGISTISWEGSGTVNVAVILESSNDSITQKTMLLGETSENSIQTDKLIPGQSYVVFLTDSSFSILAGSGCTVPVAPTFSDGLLKDSSVKIKLEKREFPKNAQKPKKVNKLSAAKIVEGLKDGSNYYGVKYHMQMPKLAKPRTFFVTLVFEAPNGFMTVERAVDVTFDRVSGGYQELWWEITGPEFVYDLYNFNEQIPTGTYSIHLYWDGMKVNTSTFEVEE